MTKTKPTKKRQPNGKFAPSPRSRSVDRLIRGLQQTNTDLADRVAHVAQEAQKWKQKHGLSEAYHSAKIDEVARLSLRITELEEQVKVGDGAIRERDAARAELHVLRTACDETVAQRDTLACLLSKADEHATDLRYYRDKYAEILKAFCGTRRVRWFNPALVRWARAALAAEVRQHATQPANAGS
jgi:hypothetical protein